MLDSDLAVIYGVTAKRLNEQLKRNRARFPDDFAFQLTVQEFMNLKSQIATSSLKSQFVISRSHGGKRKLPWVFTEHGALMLASVLNSEIAVQASVRVVRAFVRLREMVVANAQLAAKHEFLVGYRSAGFGLDPVVAGVVRDGDDSFAKAEIGAYLPRAQEILPKTGFPGSRTVGDSS